MVSVTHNSIKSFFPFTGFDQKKKKNTKNTTTNAETLTLKNRIANTETVFILLSKEVKRTFSNF